MSNMVFEIEEFEARFSALNAYDPVVLAISGGSDSMALMVLVKRWAEHVGRALPSVATVDHGLRAGSDADVQFVAGAARQMGFEHHALKWVGDKPETGVQEAARLARYRLLAELVQRLPGVDPSKSGAIVTAHHQEDQAETLLMRLARGSGIDGLSAMHAAESSAHGVEVAILRPLLDVPKRRLVDVLRQTQTKWLEDPSNADERFERVRLRQAQKIFDEAGLNSEAVARSARRLHRARVALNDMTTETLSQIVNVHNGAWCEIAREEFDGLSEEIQLRVLNRVVMAFGGQEQPVRLRKLEQLCDALASQKPIQDAYTLGGAVICSRSLHYAVFREAGRRGLAQLPLRPGENAVWDNRFEVTVPADLEFGMTLGALGAAMYTELRACVEPQLDLMSRAAATLPSVWRGDELVLVPHLGYTALPAGVHGPELRFLWHM